MKNVSLTFSQKLEICQEASRRTFNNEPFTQLDIAKWVACRFNLRKPPNQTTISRMLKTPTKFNIRHTSNEKRSSTGKIGRIEKALFDWVIAKYHARRAVNGNLIRTVSARRVKRANEAVSEDRRIEMNFSSGWLTRFQDCWSLRCFKSHGESGDADMAPLAQELPKLRELFRNYNKRDIFNADESGFYYRMAPDKTIARAQLMGRKKEKTRFTFMSCCNAEGTEKIPLKIIRTAAKPRCFKKKSGREHGFDYDNNKKAWMTSSIFFEWLEAFSRHIGKTAGRKVLLVVDNCSAHGTKETIPKHDNVEVVFLPPNFNSQVQPLDAGIIAAVKMRYRRKQHEMVLDLIDESVDNIYNIDQLTAMRMITNVWEELPGEIISTCWKHTNLLHNTVHRVANRVPIANLLCQEEER